MDRRVVCVISIVVPTIKGREDHLERCLAAYNERTVDDFEIIVIRDRPVVGIAWNDGAAEARGDYLHFTADDLEPHEAWDVGAREAVDRGFVPSPAVYEPDRTCSFCGVWGGDYPDWAYCEESNIPFMSMQAWEIIGPVLPVHYYSDNWISWHAQQHGYRHVVRRGYAFTHHWAQVGRGAGMTQEQRMVVDREAYEKAKAAHQ